MSDDLFEHTHTRSRELTEALAATRGMLRARAAGQIVQIEWLPGCFLPDPASRRFVLLWLAAPVQGLQCIVGFYDHRFCTWRDIDGDTVPQQAVTHWAEVEGPA